MKEPLLYFFEKDGFSTNNIKNIICGEKYVAVILNNGYTGVCATLNLNVSITKKDITCPDLNNIKHRIVLNAYYNALYNYKNQYNTSIDIFDKINFKDYSKIVMIGFFRSLVKKFESENIDLTIFDLEAKDNRLAKIENQLVKVAKADALILSSTTVFNNTFLNLVNSTKDNCHIYTLGPSTILNKNMFQYKNIKLLFGATFEKNDTKTLEVIKSGGGTKQFLPYMTKVFFKL